MKLGRSFPFASIQYRPRLPKSSANWFGAEIRGLTSAKRQQEGGSALGKKLKGNL